jgi:predicted pyridoxine 5'-phosphate oxidase superfamily flavin-nucleotide-binding protein
MIPEKLLEVLKFEGVVAIVTQGDKEPHVVNTWNSYVKITEDNRILIPAGYMHITERNIEKNNKVQLTLGSKEVQGSQGPGTGFLVKGTAGFIKSGSDFEATKEKFPWARATLEVNVDSVAQKI